MHDISDQDRELAILLADLERQFDERGWDQPHNFLTIESDGEEYYVQSTPLEVENPAPAWLDSLARLFEDDPEMPERLIETQPLIHGFVFAYEAYRAAGLYTEAQVEALNASLRPDQDYGDVPGAKEMRGMIGVTMDGAAVQLLRDRGAPKPIAVPWQARGGQILQALLRLTIVVARRKGEPTAKLEAILGVCESRPPSRSDF